MTPSLPTGDEHGHQCISTDVDDRKLEAAVLEHLIFNRDVHLTHDELIRELSGASDQFGLRDGFVRAIRDLVGIGVLHRLGEFVIPSRAAIRQAELHEL